ncbi:MAG: M56 family metallopeptidase [Pirellulaceae bacterium]
MPLGGMLVSFPPDVSARDQTDGRNRGAAAARDKVDRVTAASSARPDALGVKGPWAFVSHIQLFRDRTADAIRPCLPWVAALWLGGVLLLAAWNLGGWIVVERLRRTGKSAGAEADARLARLAARLQAPRNTRLLESSLVGGPVALGWLRPVVLAPPRMLQEMPSTELDAVLAHELAHIRRRDYVANLAQALAETLLFYHPAVWWLSARIRLEREFCCDDVACAACGGEIIYAKALANVAQRPDPALSLALNGRSESMIVHRVRRILSAKTGRNEASFAATALSLAMLLSLVVSLAWASPPLPQGKPEGPAAPIADKASPADNEPAAATAPEKNATAQRAVRQIFRPTTTGIGDTSWSGLFESKALGNKGELMMMVSAHRGDRWPVSIAGTKEKLFEVELIDGDDKQVELKILADAEERRLVLKLDRAEKLKLAGREFSFSYGTSMVEGDEPQYVDFAHLIITMRTAAK